MSLIKTINSKHGTANIYDDYIPKKESDYKINLKNVYGVINKIAHELERENVDTKELFYTKEELDIIKKNNSHKFI